MKKKISKITTKKIMKGDDYIVRRDANTFYVKSSDPNKEPYLVFHELVENETRNQDRWLCDCMDFTLRIVDSNGPVPECKHIKACKLL